MYHLFEVKYRNSVDIREFGWMSSQPRIAKPITVLTKQTYAKRGNVELVPAVVYLSQSGEVKKEHRYV